MVGKGPDGSGGRGNKKENPPQLVGEGLVLPPTEGTGANSESVSDRVVAGANCEWASSG